MQSKKLNKFTSIKSGCQFVWQVVILLFLCLGFSHLGFANIDVFKFKSVQQEREYHDLTQQLRCPQCQNNSIADSNAIIATDMREKVFELLQQGKTKQQVIEYMVDRYGNFVTYDPPVNATTIILWLAPALLLCLGTAWLLFRRKVAMKEDKSSEYSQTEQITSELTIQEQQRLEQLLKNKE